MALLSHYTSRAGLEGIASSRSFWATNFLELNDTSEYFYAWSILQRSAFEETMKLVPDNLKLPNCDIDAQSRAMLDQFRNSLRGTDGYGHIYITSFARGVTGDHDRRGLLTIWDRYTRLEGYCLQFERSDLEHLIQLDSYRANYASLGFAPVTYGVDKKAHTYRELVFQLSQRMLLEIIRAGHRIPHEPEWNKMWAETALARGLLDFCSMHKDPCFEDEREMRLFCCPNPQAEARVFTGIASAPKIHTNPAGRRYVVVGDKWVPGIQPRRIIVGPRANRDISNVLAMYDGAPEVAYADMPLAA